jgi:hypothetical protein
VLNHIDAVSTMDVRTVSEFLDIFPEELPGMHQTMKLSLLLN